MNRLFGRFFVLVMGSLTAATLLIYLASRWLFGDPLDNIALRRWRPTSTACGAI